MGGHIMTLARFEAKKAVKEIFRRQGLKVAHIEASEITKAANTYLLEHPELIDQAAESFRSDPVFMKLAKQHERQLKKKQAISEETPTTDKRTLRCRRGQPISKPSAASFQAPASAVRRQPRQKP